MTPTNELRFVERTIYVNAASGELKYSQYIRILQQKWTLPTNTSETIGPQFVWRDVPLVEEKP
jgi:hypothetical protein